jgi:hypothetical protein
MSPSPVSFTILLARADVASVLGQLKDVRYPALARLAGRSRLSGHPAGQEGPGSDLLTWKTVSAFAQIS